MTVNLKVKLIKYYQESKEILLDLNTKGLLYNNVISYIDDKKNLNTVNYADDYVSIRKVENISSILYFSFDESYYTLTIGTSVLNMKIILHDLIIEDDLICVTYQSEEDLLDKSFRVYELIIE